MPKVWMTSEEFVHLMVDDGSFSESRVDRVPY